MSAITITDDVTGQTTGLIDTDSIIDALTPWYPEAPEEITTAIAALQDHMESGDWPGANGLATFLALRYERPSVAELLEFIADATAAVDEAAERVASANAERNQYIRTAFSMHVPGPTIADAARMTTSRAYQIRDSTR